MNSRIFYRGPSQLDGAPILGIISGLEIPSRNAKTGDMLQTYILREDLSPVAAVASGDDRSICGDCALRGGSDGRTRRCYVQVGWAPMSLWETVYPTLKHWYTPQNEQAIVAGVYHRFLRIGTYGDPAAIPAYVWEWLLAQHPAGWTGYTHQWRRAEASNLKPFCMASVDTLEELREAHHAGWRTFRSRHRTEPLARGEITCPASAEAGHKTTCAQCRLCSGTRADNHDVKSVAIILHGNGRRLSQTLSFPFEAEESPDGSREHEKTDQPQQRRPRRGE